MTTSSFYAVNHGNTSLFQPTRSTECSSCGSQAQCVDNCAISVSACSIAIVSQLDNDQLVGHWPAIVVVTITASVMPLSAEITD